MNPILNIISIRVKNLHINPADPQDNTAFSSINKAKAHSRKLGGAGKVKACKDKAEAFDFIEAYKKAMPKKLVEHLATQESEFNAAANAEESKS